MSNTTCQSTEYPTEYPTEDHLDEDKPFKQQVKKQNWCVVSMLTPKCFPESKRDQYKDQKILGIKIRGVFEEYTEAQERATHLQKVDKFHNIFVGEVGKWLPFDVDTTNMGSEDQVYREKSLNKYMKAYKDSLHDEDETEKSRKSDMLKGANIVTGKHQAPESTELGVLDSENKSGTTTSTEQPGTTTTTTSTEQPGTTTTSTEQPGTTTTTSEQPSSREDKLDTELESTTKEKVKLQQDLSSSKVSLQALEEKLATISAMYSELKSN